MPGNATSAARQPISSYNPFDLLRIYTYYRILLGSLLIAMFLLNFAPEALGNEDPELFFYSTLFYTCINVLSLPLLWQQKFNPSNTHLFGSLLLDVGALMLIMHSCGGAQSGIGYLLLIATAAGSIMLREQMAYLLAATTTLVVLGEGSYRLLVLHQDSRLVFASGVLSLLVFAITLLFQYLTRKIRLSHQETQQQAAQAAHLQRLAQLIIERMRTGILVLDKHQHIELINQAASTLFSQDNRTPSRLEELPSLHVRYLAWRQQKQDSGLIRQEHPDAPIEIRANFAQLEADNPDETLVFLEDVRALNQQAQQLKLASLGRLTASIAHEVRNPLGAISHASQLLAESPLLDASDRRLLQIIESHSKRVNQIIENVLRLSRRRHATPQPLELSQWIPTFIEEYITSKAPLAPRITFADLQETNKGENARAPSHPGRAKFDPSQLQQVLTNLCDNALRYTREQADGSQVRIEIGEDLQYQQPFIRVIDFGEGLSSDAAQHLFEPFFTTENTGSGLGLYICQELCEANQALISYRRTEQGGSCFHIQLAHPDKAL